MSKQNPPDGYLCERLNASTHSREAFDCESEALNDFLKQRAGQAQDRNLSSTHVLVAAEDPRPAVCPIIGYITLHTCDIPFMSVPDRMAKGIPRTQPIPAMLLARMGVDRHHKNKKLGKFLLELAFEEAIAQSERSGCVFLVVDPKEDAKDFYLKFKFLSMPTSSRLVISVAGLKIDYPHLVS